jgi:hypothetical protein
MPVAGSRAYHVAVRPSEEGSQHASKWSSMTQSIEIRDATVAADDMSRAASGRDNTVGRGGARGRPMPIDPGLQDGGAR